MHMSPEDVVQLLAAKNILENPGMAAKLTNLLGSPIEKGFELLPDNWRDKVGAATRQALTMALKGALLTMDAGAKESYPVWHKVAATVSGGVGGVFGLPALAVPVRRCGGIGLFRGQGRVGPSRDRSVRIFGGKNDFRGRRAGVSATDRKNCRSVPDTGYRKSRRYGRAADRRHRRWRHQFNVYQSFPGYEPGPFYGQNAGTQVRTGTGTHDLRIVVTQALDD